MAYPFQNLIPVPRMLTEMDYYLDPVPFSAPASFAVDYTNAFEYPDTASGVMGNLVGNMLSSHLHSSSSLYLTNEKFGDQETIQFPEHQSPRQTFLQLLEENNTGTQEVQMFDSAYLKLPVLEEATNQKALESAPQQLRVLMPSCPRNQAATYVEQPEGCVSVTIDSECSQALSINALPKGSNGFVTEFTTDLAACSHHEYVAECSHQESQQSRSASSSEKSQKLGQLVSTDLTFASGQLLSGYEPENQKRPKRKRTRSCKKIEEVESQRQVHIAVERNRRKQMNEQLTILRSLMPVSYVSRGDQASIVGGAIDFVNELEHVLECLQEQKRRRMYAEALRFKLDPLSHDTFPLHHQQGDFENHKSLPVHSKYVHENFYDPVKEICAESKSEIAEVEVQINGRDALVKILSQRMSGQLHKAIASFENLGMTIMHANISTVERTVLYSFNVKLERGCHLGAADELAAAAQQIFQAIHDRA
ncbi:hypothetical protein O6H91_04G101800 [Diphasiastrum complanatum]|uniref:Uncharacterized protein n=1 Tax=Diphasiastrum complanatum TaxID=34168 RepID=A0ACC2E006_DIPCM|nr:hypothetical protein O6H91_04G101800 [Diphasiastrum complanatum]